MKEIEQAVTNLVNGKALDDQLETLLWEQADGKSASAVEKKCPHCGQRGTMRVVIPRHGEDPISRCPECGKNVGPGQPMSKGAGNYSGGASSHYDETTQG
jgi:predicted RNA-binding Zn-ribbon protein involved in translation (DUF1610 family)